MIGTQCKSYADAGTSEKIGEFTRPNDRQNGTGSRKA
jgi:hypothetical protein